MLLKFRYFIPFLFLIDNVRSISHLKDNERRLQAGARFNLSSAKLRIILCVSKYFSSFFERAELINIYEQIIDTYMIDYRKMYSYAKKKKIY